MNDLLNAHVSLQAYTAALADLWPNTESMNFDALADITQLPAGDIVGLRSFAISSSNDVKPLPVASGMILVVTYDDPSNDRLMTRLNQVFNDLKPEKTLPLYDAESAEVIGEMKFMGVTRCMPLERNGNRAVQGITFQAGLQAVV